MKKYFLLTVISAVLFLTACGSNQSSTVDTTVQTSATTLNSVTEMTVPAFTPNNVSQDMAIDTMSASETTAAVTTIEANEENEFPVYEGRVISNNGTYIAVELLTYSFFGNEGDEVHIYGEFEAEKGDDVDIIFKSDDVEVLESYPPEVYCSDVQIDVTGHSSVNYENSKYEYTARVIGVNEESVTVSMLEDTYFCKANDEVVLLGKYEVSEDNIVLFVISGEDDAPPVVLLENSQHQIGEGYVQLESLGGSDEPFEIIAEVTEVYESKNGGYTIIAEAYGLWGYYDAVPISLAVDELFEAGDRVAIEFAPETVFMETSPLQVNSDDVLNVKLID